MASKPKYTSTRLMKRARQSKVDESAATTPWSDQPAQPCLSCNQDTHSIDRDSPSNEPYYLKWTKTYKAKKIIEGKHGICKQMEYQRCTGSECDRCFDTRRRYFHPLSQSELQKKRTEDAETDQAFVDKRRERAQWGFFLQTRRWHFDHPALEWLARRGVRGGHQTASQGLRH